MAHSTASTDMLEKSNDDRLQVAIIGGGITGLALATGLLQRNIDFKIYERAKAFREIGAGIAFTPNAERAMKLLNPAIHAAYRKVAVQNDEDYFYYMDGYNYSGERPEHEETILKLYLGERGFEGCRRSDFMDEMVNLIPKGHVQLSKEIVSVTERGESGLIHLVFKDGSTATADVGKCCQFLCEPSADHRQ